ncbi:hypothetical protein PVAP13_6KG200024 [Panicum virgatum]|uniref:Uncharacterized protein n=1 Tax=Panicum virgatum TaxID=38727 RepID=A0A8T0RDJ6_PANVG|nr:hypothetical protein PVAP13_6KG200024 [Panicum virgatum]
MLRALSPLLHRRVVPRVSPLVRYVACGVGLRCLMKVKSRAPGEPAVGGHRRARCGGCRSTRPRPSSSTTATPGPIASPLGAPQAPRGMTWTSDLAGPSACAATATSSMGVPLPGPRRRGRHQRRAGAAAGADAETRQRHRLPLRPDLINLLH